MSNRKATRIALETSETVNRTLTAGSQNVTLSIVGSNVTVTGGTPEAVAIVSAVLGIVAPAPAGPAPAPARAKATAGKASGRGAGQAGRKRGPYKTRKAVAATAQATPDVQTPAAVPAETNDDDAETARIQAELDANDSGDTQTPAASE
jgi:hypothetical protein